jgi:hypothetical protein
MSSPEPEKLLPCLTVCPFQGYKIKNTLFAGSDFTKNTFAMEEIFSERTLQELNNKSLYEVQEIKTMILGRCYTICFLKKVKIIDYVAMVELKKTFDVTVFLHQKHEEFWIKMFGPPTQIFISRLTLEKDMFGADLLLTEKHQRYLNKEHAPCKSYSLNDNNNNNEEELLSFFECLQKSLLVNVGSKLTCILPFMSDLLPNTTLAGCSERSDIGRSFQTYSYFIKDFIQKIAGYGCPLPCSFITYNVVTRYFHKNLGFDSGEGLSATHENFFRLSLIYDTLIIEENVESYDYDSADFLIYVGGNLGLFLGFSCLSTLTAILRYVYSFCLKNKK